MPGVYVHHETGTRGRFSLKVSRLAALAGLKRGPLVAPLDTGNSQAASQLCPIFVPRPQHVPTGLLAETDKRIHQPTTSIMACTNHHGSGVVTNKRTHQTTTAKKNSTNHHEHLTLVLARHGQVITLCCSTRLTGGGGLAHLGIPAVGGSEYRVYMQANQLQLRPSVGRSVTIGDAL